MELVVRRDYLLHPDLTHLRQVSQGIAQKKHPILAIRPMGDAVTHLEDIRRTLKSRGLELVREKNAKGETTL